MLQHSISRPKQVADIQSVATDLLQNAKVDTPRLDAQLLLAWAMETTREQLAMHAEREIDQRAGLIFWKALNLRCQRRPLPYITGRAWFYGHEFRVNRAVLIPRPETEMLVDFANSVAPKNTPFRVADIGTGSGCIAVSIALELPDSKLVAVDISPLALRVAAKNVAKYQLESRLGLVQGDLLTPFLDSDWQFDLIVSNPPYVPIDDKPNLMPEVREYEPELALFGENADSQTPSRLRQKLLTQAKTCLAPNGWIAIEIGHGQNEQAIIDATDAGFDEITVLNDNAGIGRVLTARNISSK